MADEKKVEMKEKENMEKVEKEIKKDLEKEVKAAATGSTSSNTGVPSENPQRAGKKKVAPKKEVKVYDRAIANGFSMRISAKYAKFVCRMIVGKSPDAAVERLQAVVDERRAVPMAGLEVGHKKGKGLSGGKFPKTACLAIMEIVKQAKANANVLGVENQVISQAVSNRSSRPFKKGGRKGKRAHVMIEIKDRVKMKEAKK